MHTLFSLISRPKRLLPLIGLSSLALLMACTEKPAETTSASPASSTEAPATEASSASAPAIVTPSQRQLSPGQLDMAHAVLEAMKTKQYDSFASHIHPSFAAELKANPKLMDEMAGFIPHGEPVKPPKLYAMEDVQYEGYGNMLMATFDYPYENRNMLFVIAFDAAEGSTSIKSLAVNSFPGIGDYMEQDEGENTEASSVAQASE